MFDLKDYDYRLPEGLIAQVPAARRDHSRLLVVDRRKESFSDHRFADLPHLLRSGDLLVANNTRVVPARLSGRKQTGGQVEVLVLEPRPNDGDGEEAVRLCLMKSSKGPRVGQTLYFQNGVTGEVQEVLEEGVVKVAFGGEVDVDSLMFRFGRMPLPPYIRRHGDKSLDRIDRVRYQTIFSQHKGAVAAPTAGLHFTRGLVERLNEKGIPLTFVTLHVGHGTFRPVRHRDIRSHPLGKESYRIEPETAQRVMKAKSAGRVVAVGTTVVRALESAVGSGGGIRSGEGETELLITPGFSFQVVDALITNFHLPRSSLLFLVSAFAGLELTRAAYEWAVKQRYRFYSYGDAMLIV